MSVERQKSTMVSEGNAASRGERLTRTDALPDVNFARLGVPYTALRVEGPVDIELPYSGCVADEGRHDGARVGARWTARTTERAWCASDEGRKRRRRRRGRKETQREYIWTLLCVCLGGRKRRLRLRVQR